MSNIFNNNCILDFFYDVRRRGFTRVFIFEGGAVISGISLYILGNVGPLQYPFLSGFGVGMSCVGIFGVMSLLSEFQVNFNMGRISSFFLMEGGSLGAGITLLTLSQDATNQPRLLMRPFGLAFMSIGLVGALCIFRRLDTLECEQRMQLFNMIRHRYIAEEGDDRTSAENPASQSIKLSKTSIANDSKVKQKKTSNVQLNKPSSDKNMKSENSQESRKFRKKSSEKRKLSFSAKEDILYFEALEEEHEDMTQCSMHRQASPATEIDRFQNQV